MVRGAMYTDLIKTFADRCYTFWPAKWDASSLCLRLPNYQANEKVTERDGSHVSIEHQLWDCASSLVDLRKKWDFISTNWDITSPALQYNTYFLHATIKLLRIPIRFVIHTSCSSQDSTESPAHTNIHQQLLQQFVLLKHFISRGNVGVGWGRGEFPFDEQWLLLLCANCLAQC